MGRTLTAAIWVALALLCATCETDAGRVEYECSCTIDCPADATTFPWTSWVCAGARDTASKKARNNCEDVFTSQCGAPTCQPCTCTLSTRPNGQGC